MDMACPASYFTKDCFCKGYAHLAICTHAEAGCLIRTEQDGVHLAIVGRPAGDALTLPHVYNTQHTIKNWPLSKAYMCILELHNKWMNTFF